MLTRAQIIETFNAGGPSWLPDLTFPLVNHRFAELQQQTHLTPETYTTNRFLLSIPNSPCLLKGRLELIPNTPYSHCAIAIEDLDERFCKKYYDLGINFRSLHDVQLPNIIFMLQRALKEVNRIPSLARVIQTIVRSMHILESSNKETDCSYSDPEIPFSIFLSVPSEETDISFLRLAESIIHECMHLQLTLLERHITLIEDGPSRYFSPWLNIFRPAKGLLHGIFVFRVICDFLEEMREQEELWKISDYIMSRVEDISNQLIELDYFRNAPELTSVGRMFVGKLLINKINCH